MGFDQGLSLKGQARLASYLDQGLLPTALKIHADHFLLARLVEGRSTGTLKKYGFWISRFLKHLSTRELSTHEVRLFLLDIESSGASTAYRHQAYRTLKAWCNWMEAENFLVNNPFTRNFHPPRLDDKVIPSLTPNDIDRLLLMCSAGNFTAVRNRAIVLIYIDTGVRLAEMSGLQLGDIDLADGIIKVFGKGRKERIVRMGVLARKALLSYLMMRHDELPGLWVSEERREMHSWGIHTATRRLMRAAGIKGVKLGPHTFRHTCAVMFLQNSKHDVYALQHLLGHSRIQTTERYIRSLNAGRQVVEVHKRASPIDNLLGGKIKNTPGR